MPLQRETRRAGANVLRRAREFDEVVARCGWFNPSESLTEIRSVDYPPQVIFTVPDSIENTRLTPEEIRLGLACALYARGRIGRVAATELAGVDFFAFQRALGERSIPICTEQMLEEDLAAIKVLVPR